MTDSQQAAPGNSRPAVPAALFAVLVLAASLAGTLVLYREALVLPLFFDDMVHLRWLEWHTLPEVWTTAEGLGYYRPLTMSVWKVEQLLLGDHGPQRLHLLSLLLHGLNAALAGWVGWRAFHGRGRHAYTLLTAMIFLTFPFSYQAVPSTSSLSKPLIATLVLVSALLYWEGRRRRAWWLIGLSLLAGFLAPFAYESGVMVPLAILSVEAYARLRREFDRFSWLPLLYMLLIWGLTLPLIILAEPETGASLSLPAVRSLWQNGIYFLEALLFPISPVVTPLVRILGVDQYILLTAVVLLGLAAVVAFYWWAKQVKLFLYALSWFVVGLLPLWLALDFAYVITSPRILYLGAVGAALLWAGLPVLLWTRLPERRWAKVLALAGAVAMLAFNTVYVRDKMELATTVAVPLWQAARAAEGFDEDDTLLYLNVPVWIAPKQATYRVGTEGLTFIPEYVRPQDFVYVNSGREPDIQAVMFDPVKQDRPDYIGYAGEGLDPDELADAIRRADGVYLTSYAPDALSFVPAGALEESNAPPPDGVPVAHFDDGLWLVEAETTAAQDGLEIGLQWYVSQPLAGEATIFLHVYNAAGQLVAQGDGYPLAGLFPPRYWQAGDLVRDVRHITIPEDLASGDYVVVVGWYDPTSGQRLPAMDGQGQSLANDAVQVYQFAK
jgi:hypothetical protein